MVKKILDIYLSIFKNFVNFSGRSNRLEFFLFALASLILGYGGLGIIFGIAFLMAQSADSTASGAYAFIAIIFVVIYESILGLILFLPTISLTARRLHDFGVTGWVQVIFYILYFFIPRKLIYIFGLIISIVLSLIPGTEGENQYGLPSEKTLKE